MNMKTRTNLVGDFDRDVPGHLHEDVMVRIVEAAWEVGSEDPDISINDVEKINALNIEFTGTILIDEVEHSFQIRDGNIAGTEILSWNEDTAIHREDPIVTTLVPLHYTVGDAIYRGQAGRLLQDWDAALDPTTETGASLSRLPGAAAYDAFFAPGTGASRSHHEKARAAGYEIREMADAIRVRAKLLGSAFLPCPVGGPDADPAATLQDWSASLVSGSDLCAARDKVIAAMSARGTSEPMPDDQEPLLAQGYRLQPRARAIALRTELTRRLLSLEELDGFDPADLPENPVATLFQRLDPDLVSNTRVNPVREGRELLDGLARQMARAESLELPPDAQDRAARLGLQIVNLAEPGPDQDLDYPSP